MTELTPTGKCFHNFRDGKVTRKSFFVIILVQFILLVFMIAYNESGLHIRNGRFRTKSTERYLMKTTARAVSNTSRTNTRHSNKATPIQETVDPYFTRKNKSNVTMPRCHLVSPYLQGKIPVDLNYYDEETLSKRHPLVNKGGFYRPWTCRSRHRVAIIIPYRNRKKNLHTLLNNLHPFLQKQQLDYKIFVIELAPNVAFNRALCFNIGFLEAFKKFDFECFIFHDVDLIPENDNNMYYCSENPRHLSVAIDKFDYELPYMSIFGGVTAMTKDQFELVNGYSNKFFGWGGEDDDMYSRIRNLGVSITRYTPDVSSYKMLKHGNDPNLNENRFDFLKIGLDRWREDGLNTIKYEVLQTTRRRLYTYILADIDENDTAYQPWTKGSGNRTSDETLDPVVEELLLDKAKYLLNKLILDDDVVYSLKRDFRYLNTTNVTMQNVAGLIRKLFPPKSPVPINVPNVIGSSGNKSNSELESRSNDAQRNPLPQTQESIEHRHTQQHDQKSSQLVQAESNIKNSFKSFQTQFQNQKLVYSNLENRFKEVQKQKENKYLKMQDRQIPVQSVDTKMKKKISVYPGHQHQQWHPVHPDQTKQESKQIVYPGQTRHDNEQPVYPGQTRHDSQQPVYPGQIRHDNQQPVYPGQTRHDNQQPVNPGKAEQKQWQPVHPEQVHQEIKNSGHPGQEQYDNQQPVHPGQAEKDRQKSVVSRQNEHTYNQRQQQNHNPTDSLKTRIENHSSEQHNKTHQGNMELVNSVLLQHKNKVPTNVGLTQQDNKHQINPNNKNVNLQTQDQAKEQPKDLQRQNQPHADPSLFRNTGVGQPRDLANKQTLNFKEFHDRFKVPKGWENMHFGQENKPPFDLPQVLQERINHMRSQKSQA